MNSMILSGGIFYESFALDFCKKNSFDCVIAADRGVAYAGKLGIRPDYIVGDFDSYIGEMAEGIPVERYPSQKDYTDTHLAVEKALGLGSDTLTILCGTGGRLDHFMANLAILSMCCRKGVDAYMVDPWNRMRMLRSGITIEKVRQYGTYVSLLAYSDQVTGVTLTGFKYPLHEAVLNNAESLGASNELVQEKGKIELKEGILLMIESKDVKSA